MSRMAGKKDAEVEQKEKDVEKLKKNAKVQARPRKRGKSLTDGL